MAKDRLNEYELFYQEIPAYDYLLESDSEIEDIVDDHVPDHGLDDNQVSRLAQDAITKTESTEITQHLGDPQLFQDRA